jgi:hypothetical protein
VNYKFRSAAKKGIISLCKQRRKYTHWKGVCQGENYFFKKNLIVPHSLIPDKRTSSNSFSACGEGGSRRQEAFSNT